MNNKNNMSVSLHAPPPLTHQDGLPPFSAQRAHATPASSAVAPPRHPTHASTASALSTSSPPPSTSPSPRSVAGSTAAPSLSSSSFLPNAPAETARPNSRTHGITWADAAYPIDEAATAAATAATAASRSGSAPPSSASSSSSSIEHPSLHRESPSRPSADKSRRAGEDLYNREGATLLHSPATQALDKISTTQLAVSHHSPTRELAASAKAAALIAVPLPTLVEQQKRRIHELVLERDGLAEELRELQDLFRDLSNDYEHAAQESEARQLALDSLQTQQKVSQEELLHLRAAHAQQSQRIDAFETEWEGRTKHLRAQLDALMQDRDAMQDQRDLCMSENSDLRRQLVQLQGQLHDLDVKHRGALREQADTHARELRAALDEKEEQLQARAAATRHEARLVQQQMSHIGTSQTAIQEDREALRWRLSELELVLEKKEHLRGELERMVGSLRAQVADCERQGRSDAQRYTQRAHELEQTYQAQLDQEQHRCRTLQDELAAARRALQEAHRQHELLAETHSAHTREAAARAAKQEDELREQLRHTRATLAEVQAQAARHEAAAHRSQREAEGLRTAAASQQEERAQQLEAQAAQSQQLLRAEGRVEILKTRLQEKEREAELLRCTMEQTTWTAEMREAMQHSLAAALGVPRATAAKWLRGHSIASILAAEGSAKTPQLEWAPRPSPPSSPPKSAAPPPAEPTEASHITHSSASAVRKATPSSTQPSDLQHPPGRLDGDTQTPHKAAEAIALHSPVRAAAASTQAATAQHVESIERTIAREGRRSVTSPATYAVSSPAHSYAAPPLHPDTSSAAAAAAPQAARAASLRLPRPSLAPAGASATLSASSAFPLQALSFTSAHAETRASLRRHPSQPRHQYNVTGEEEMDVDVEEDEEESVSGDAAHAGNSAEKGRAEEGEEEVFFDDFHTPSARREETQRRVLPISMPMSNPARMAARSAGDGAASSSPSSPSPHGAGRGKEGEKARASPAENKALIRQTHATPSTPGARAAELLALLPMPSAAVAASASSIPFSSEAAAAARQQRVDHLHDDQDGLQQYLRETVQQVLATQQDNHHPLRSVQHSKIGPVPPYSSAGAGTRGHSHYTQLYDGSPLHSAQSRRTGSEREGDVLDEDFGSVSRPRSVLSMLPWQQQQQQHRQQQQRAAPTTPARDITASSPRVVISGQHEVQSGAPHDRSVVLSETKPGAGQAAQETSRTSAREGLSAKRGGRGDATQRQSVTRLRVEGGVAETLEQLARRQQELLQALENGNNLPLMDVKSTFPSAKGGGNLAFADASVWAGQPRGSQQHPQQLVAHVKAASTTEASGDSTGALLPTRHNLGSSGAEPLSELSEMTSSSAVLDPRQLSYATTTATTTHMADRSVTAMERSAGGAGGSSRLTRPLQARSAEVSVWDSTSGMAHAAATRQDASPSQSHAAQAEAKTSATPPSASPLPAPAPGVKVSSPASSGNTTRRADPVVSSSPQLWTGGAPPARERRHIASETEFDMAATTFQERDEADGGRAGESDAVPATQGITAVAGTATASALTCVSEASSLTQLEWRFAQPFSQ